MLKTKKEIENYLKGKRSIDGKVLFDKWADIITQESEKMSGCVDDRNLSVRIKKGIERKILQQRKLELEKAQFRSVIFKIVAVLVLGVLAYGAYHFSDNYSEPAEIVKTVEYVEKVAPYGEKLKVYLSDGTKAYLNSGSKIRYVRNFENQKNREIELEGEAYFIVKRNTSKPFVVRSGEIRTTVLGTKFNVKAYKDEENIEVAVNEGRVKVNSVVNRVEPEEVYLTKNMIANYSNNKLKEKHGDVNSIIAWKNNEIIFDNIPLKEVAKILHRWYGRKIVIENKELQNKQFIGRHKNQTLNQVLESIAFVTGAKVILRDDVIYLY